MTICHVLGFHRIRSCAGNPHGRSPLVASSVVAERLSILDGVRERFAGSTDFTVGLEEEYQLLDPATCGLIPRFNDLVDAAPADLAPNLAGELISSEIEYRTDAHAGFVDAARDLCVGRLAVADLSAAQGVAIGITGCHPFSRWQDQQIIDTPHYQRVEDELGYIAWINNTWSQHLHVGIRDADRAIAMGYLPPAHASIGTVVQALVRGRAVPMQVCALPFVAHRYVRA